MILFGLFYDKCAYILYYSIKFDYIPKHVMGEKWFLECKIIYVFSPESPIKSVSWSVSSVLNQINNIFSGAL